MRLRKNGSQISPDFLTKTAKRMLPTGQGLREATDEWNEKVIKKGVRVLWSLGIGAATNFCIGSHRTSARIRMTGYFKIFLGNKNDDCR